MHFVGLHYPNSTLVSKMEVLTTNSTDILVLKLTCIVYVWVNDHFVKLVNLVKSSINLGRKSFTLRPILYPVFYSPLKASQPLWNSQLSYSTNVFVTYTSGHQIKFITDGDLIPTQHHFRGHNSGLRAKT